MGYKEDIQIDIDQLDKEWVKQAATYQYYAKQEAMALYNRDQLADKLALTQAQLDGDIRLDFKKHGFESKPTEAAILNSIKQNPFYIKANSLLMKASCKAKIIGGAVRSFDHKKKALEKLTDLYLSGYWAGPKIKSEAQEMYGEQAKEQMDAILRKEKRMIAASLKREDHKAKELKPATDVGGKAVTAKKKATTVKAASKKAVVSRGKTAAGKTAAGKTKPKAKTETKPTGRTMEELTAKPKTKPKAKPPSRKAKQ